MYSSLASWTLLLRQVLCDREPADDISDRLPSKLSKVIKLVITFQIKWGKSLIKQSKTILSLIQYILDCFQHVYMKFYMGKYVQYIKYIACEQAAGKNSANSRLLHAKYRR